MKADVIIIGAGIAGAMAAKHLATTGCKVLLLEKNRLPRLKACGGGIPAGAMSLFGDDLHSMVEARISTLRYLFDHKEEVSKTYPGTVLYMVDRRLFDWHLVKEALTLGRGNISLLDGVAARNVVETPNDVEVTLQGGERHTATYLIAGDGANSIAAKALKLNAPVRMGTAVDARVKVSVSFFDSVRHTATFNMFCIQGGYGWIFPKQGYLSCGIGTWDVLNRRDLLAALDHFLKRSLPTDSILSIKRRVHPIPIYCGHRQIATRRICFAGDAARMVEPIMGAGIRYAAESGRLAAETISNLINGAGNDDCRTYQLRLHQELSPNLDILYRYALPVFLDAPAFFYRKFFKERIGYSSYFQAVHNRLKELKRS